MSEKSWMLEKMLPEDLMKCEKCGKSVYRYWMKERYEEEVGQRCGPCSNEKNTKAS